MGDGKPRDEDLYFELIEQGADVSIRSAKGKTAAESAEARAAQPDDERPFKEIAEMLRNA